VKLVSLRRPKVTCFLSYADYRPKTNAVILWDVGHTKERSHMGGIGQVKEAKNLTVVPVRERRWQAKRLGGWIHCKHCIHMYVNVKIIPVETVPGIGGRRMKANSGGYEFKYDIFYTW
jgi:hypothetical protein